MTWKAIDSSMCVSSFLLNEVFLRLPFNFKIGSPLGFSCLISSMFIIILIFCTIKTTCFRNTLLRPELERKLPENSCLSAHNFCNSCHFYKIYGMHLKKSLVNFYNKTFLPPLVYFWIYNPSPIGQIIFLIGAHL